MILSLKPCLAFWASAAQVALAATLMLLQPAVPAMPAVLAVLAGPAVLADAAMPAVLALLAPAAFALPAAWLMGIHPARHLAVLPSVHFALTVVVANVHAAVQELLHSLAYELHCDHQPAPQHQLDARYQILGLTCL